MATDKTDLERDTLRIGDLVVLRDVTKNCLLCCEGILLEDVSVVEGTELFQNSIFCVHLQRQYSASRDLVAFLKKFNYDVKSIKDSGAKKYLLALQRGRENERQLNDTYMRKRFGQKVVFGDIIQLYHVKSGKYVTIIPDQLAKDERENTRITLDPNGNAFSWMQIAPRFKIDKEGDRVLTNAEMYLRVFERSNEFLHTADRNPPGGKLREVNCAFESTSWRLSIYQSSLDALDPSYLLASQLVCITDPETRSTISISARKLETLDDNGEDIKLKLEDPELTESHGALVLEPIPADQMNSNYLWLMYKQAITTGGPVTWKTDCVKFRHLNTGLFMNLDIQHAEVDGTMTEEFVFGTTMDPEAPGTDFTVNEINSTTKLLSNGKAVQIGQGGIWLERGEVQEDSIFTYSVQGTREKINALSLLINRYEDTSKQRRSLPSESENSLEPLDVFSGLSAWHHLARFNEMIVVPRSEAINTIMPSAVRNDLEFFNLVADKTVYFSQGFPISATNIQLGIDKGDNSIILHRQDLLREQGVLEQVLRIVHKLIPMTDRLERIKLNSSKRKKPRVSDEEMAAIGMAQAVLAKAFEIIYYSILNHEVNQMYVADFMPVLLEHLNSQPLAGKCVTEMLSKNMELQETKIGTREIQIFVDKLRSSRMNAMYLQLLQACCSCQGDGVDGNQCKVANMLFSNTNDIIIQLHPDGNRRVRADWHDAEHEYIPAEPVPGSPVCGDDLLYKGLPQLSLAWTTNSIDYSPLGLFGRLSVNVEELFRPKASELADKKSMDKKAKAKKKAMEDQKNAVANYFIAEMFLGAEMCMDRNYVAMHKLDDLFPYEVLVTVLKLNVTGALKGAAARLLLCLHIDRDPQAKSKLPCLTRTWSDIKKNVEPQLPFVEPARMYMFGLVQLIINDYIKAMRGNVWDELSKHMLHMLRTLVEFNFYGNTRRMGDIIFPLIQLIDRRGLVKDGDDTASVRGDDKDKDKGTKVIDDDNASQVSAIALPMSATTESKRIGDEEKEEERAGTDNIDYTNDELDEDKPQQSIVRRAFMCIVDAVIQFYNLNYNVARGIAFIDDESAIKAEAYVTPSRYSKAPIFELETMVEAVDILAYTQQVIEDRNISILLRHFYDWESGADKRPPAELFEIAISESESLTLNTPGSEFDQVMIDALMYVHAPLVQSTLEVLMAHHSKRRILLDNIHDVQLLASHRRERQFKTVNQMLKQLEQNAETHELWGELESDAHHLVNKQTKEIIKELIDICRIRRQVLEFDEDFMADSQIQDLYRNLGCFEICMKVMGLLDSVEEDESGELGEVALNTRDLCLLCNTLLYWFLLGNEKNQQMGYQELDFFLDSLDGEINSHLIIKAIFQDNEALMRQVPHSILSSMVDLIVKNGKSHHYLSLFAAIPNVGERNITENQIEIVKLLTSPGRMEKVSCYLVPTSHPDYREKVELMEPFLALNRDVSVDELPANLAYHIMFLNVLSGCTVGKLEVTIAEAKVQSVCNHVDVVDAVLDPRSMLLVKIASLRFFFNAVIDVELPIPGLEKSPAVWRLLESFAEVLPATKQEVADLTALGWEAPNVVRQKIEYAMLAIMVIERFFADYFDPANYKVEAGNKPGKGTLPLARINQLIITFFHAIKDVYDLDCPRLPIYLKEHMFNALEELRKQATKYIHTSADDKHQVTLEILAAEIPALESDASAQLVATSTVRDDLELRLIQKFNEFVTALESDSKVQYKADNENVTFITILEKLPFIADRSSNADVRYESLFKKLVYHIRENIKIVNGQKRMDARVTKTAIWIIRAFRTMIENRMGMSIYERDDEGGQEQDIAAAPVVNALNSCGGTALCLDLIADGIDEKLQLEAVRLGVGLLFKEGGALEVQTLMNTHLSSTSSELFFKQVRITLQKLKAWHEWKQIIVLEEGQEPKAPDEILIVRFLQLMCEGHYLPNQDIMREQPNNSVSYNLLDDFVLYLNCLSRFPCRTSTVAGIRVAATILEVIQGPCEGNQLHFAINTEIVETINRLNRAKLMYGCEVEEEIELKKTSIDIVQALLEGQGEASAVYDRVLSVIHLDIVLIMSKKPIYNEVLVSEEQIILQTECVVLLQMLCNYRPSLYDELGISRNIEDIVGSGTAMIEVIWRGDIHRRFFHVPNVCSFLAKSSKDALVEYVDRSNAENKLIDFLSRSHGLYREVKHQQLLTEMNLSRVFSRSNQNRATWISFFLAIIINVLFVANYSNASGNAEISPLFDNLTTGLNVAQAATSFFTLLLWVVVRSPVNYQSLAAAGHSRFETILFTCTDSLTIYYVIYLALALLGVTVENYYCSLQLLDIVVKDSTTRDVLNAIVTPRWQLVFALLLEVFVVYIYTFFVFMYYRDEVAVGNGFCDTLYDCFKFTLSYGFQNGGGIGDTFNHSTGVRLILDLSFFVVVLVVLLNVFLGMIIDTFSSLRADKLERLRDTTDVCFICNIDKQVFDRASDEPDGFKTHVKIDHNMWNYLYFIFLLWEQDRDDDDGLEQYVRRAIDANEISWMPLHKAMRLDRVASKAEVLRKDLTESIQSTEAAVTARFDDFQAEVSVALQQLMATLRQDAQNAATVRKDGGLPGLEEEDDYDDQGSAADRTVVSLDGVVLGKHVSLGISQVRGLALSAADMAQVSCRLLTDSGVLSVPSVRVEAGTVYFDDTKLLPLFYNVQPSDRRSVLVQLLDGDESGGRATRFLAVLEVPVLDFVALGDGRGSLEKKFMRAEQGEVCSVHFVCDVDNARAFGARGPLARSGTSTSLLSSPSVTSRRKMAVPSR